MKTEIKNTIIMIALFILLGLYLLFDCEIIIPSYNHEFSFSFRNLAGRGLAVLLGARVIYEISQDYYLPLPLYWEEI